MNLIQIKNLQFGYSKPLYPPLNLTIEKGGCIGILGGNGAGKTTFFKTLLAIQAPLYGSVNWDINISKSWVPQETNLQSEVPFTVKDVIQMGCLRQKQTISDHPLIQRFELQSILNRPWSDLSGGQRQRALLVRALISNPDVLFLDEPLQSLDAHSKELFLKWLPEFSKEKTVFWIDHDPQVTSFYNRGIIRLENGLIEFVKS